MQAIRIIQRAQTQLRTTPLRQLQAIPSASFASTSRNKLASTEPAPEDAEDATDEEMSVLTKLQSKFQGGEIAVQDVSGGCGSFYAISIRHPEFAGLSTIKSHQMVNGILREELQKWHGVQLKTMAPDA